MWGVASPSTSTRRSSNFSTSTSRSSSNSSHAAAAGGPGGGASSGSEGPAKAAQSGPAEGHVVGAEEKEQEPAAESREGREDPAKAVLKASLPFVLECGWTEAAMLEGARAAGLSPAMLSLFPRREAHLVEYFMDECRAKFEEESAARSSELLALDDLGSRLQLVVRMRLEQQALYTSTWAQALSIQALPTNLPRMAEQRLQLIASLWGAAGERTRSDLEARALCTMLSAVYTASELFMLTDFSAGYEETWKFVQRRMSEGLQAFAGLSAAQEQIQKLSLSVFQQLGLTFPGAAAANPFPSRRSTGTACEPSAYGTPDLSHDGHNPGSEDKPAENAKH